MGNKPLVRQAILADAKVIHRLVKSEAKKKKLLARPLREIRGLVFQFLVLEIEGRAIGCVAVEIYSPRLAELRSFAVEEKFRRNGYGTFLLEAAIERAKNLGVTKLMSVTGRVPLFKKQGFSVATEEERLALFVNPQEWKSRKTNRSRK